MKLARNRVLPLCFTMSLCASWPAQAQDESEVPATRGDLSVRIEQWPVAIAPAVTAPAFVAESATSVDYRVWVDAGRASLGVGLAGIVMPQSNGFAAAPWTAGANASSMIVGVRYQVGDRSRVYFDTASLADRRTPDRDVRMGFEFKSAPSQMLGIARGTLLRVQWSSQSQVSLRLRGGGLQVAVRSHF